MKVSLEIGQLQNLKEKTIGKTGYWCAENNLKEKIMGKNLHTKIENEITTKCRKIIEYFKCDIYQTQILRKSKTLCGAYLQQYI